MKHSDDPTAEQTLRETEERFELMGRATNDLVWDWDIVNDKTWRGDVFGYGPEEVAERDFWSSRIHPEDRERVIESLVRFLASSESSRTAEYRFLRRDGTYASVLERGYVVRSPEGTALRMFGATIDVTTRTQMEEQLARANRINSLGRIAASIAHEFNNVLMGLQPNLEVLQRKAPDELRPVIEHMLHAVTRGKRVTDEIFNFTQRVSPTLERLDVGRFLTLWSQETGSILGAGVELELDVAPGLLMTADSSQLDQVFTNLALNARDAMPRGGVFRIRATRIDGIQLLGMSSRKQAGFIQFRVSDTGKGISREDLERIFEPMFTTKAGGLGLGLAVTYQIVARHEGNITVDSRAGEGTTFSILIPAAAPDDSLAQPELASPSKCRRVLIVEDEEAVAAGLKALLELEGVEVETVGTAGEAIAAIERFGPDVLVLDIGLPDMSGMDLFEQIERRWPRLPVIFSSGHGDDSRLVHWRKRAHVRVLLKPYEFAALERAIAEVLAVNFSRQWDLPD